MLAIGEIGDLPDAFDAFDNDSIKNIKYSKLDEKYLVNVVYASAYDGRWAKDKGKGVRVAF